MRRELWVAYAADENRAGDAIALDFSKQTILELTLQSALLTRTTGHGDPAPQHTVWRHDIAPGTPPAPGKK